MKKKKNKTEPFRLLIYERGNDCYYYDGIKLTKRCYEVEKGHGGYIKGRDVALTQDDLELLKKVNWKQVYKEKSNLLRGVSPRNNMESLASCSIYSVQKFVNRRNTSESRGR